MPDPRSIIKPIIHELKTNLTPAEIFSLFRYRSYSVFLDSSMIHPRYGRYSYIGINPFLIFQSRGSQITIMDEVQKREFNGNPLEELSKLISLYHLQNRPDLSPFIGGGIGYFSYDFGRQIEKIPEITLDDLRIPDCVFAFYDVLFVFDHLNQGAWLVSSGLPEIEFVPRQKRAWKRITDIMEIIKSSEKKPSSSILIRPNEQLLHTHPIKSNFTKEQYMDMVEKAKEYISAGDIYQVNLSQRFHTIWENSAWDLYLRLRYFNPATFSVFMNGKNFSILSSSPERFLRLSGKTVETRPIKGTRPRGRNAADDNKNRTELLESEKDRAELVMIIDLERNDIGRVCKYGSVTVDSFPELESYATVWHLVGTVRGILKESAEHLDCLKACFPGGSITGAPKIRAMQIIEELEPCRRGIYTGSIGYFGFNMESDFNIAIRTMVLKQNQLYFHAGGGIVADSEPEMEYDETLHKAKALFQAIKEIPDTRTYTSSQLH